jgi:hypothetical protein
MTGMTRGPSNATALPGVIKIIVPFPPGGTVDPIARMVQPGLQQRLGATIIVENKLRVRQSRHRPGRQVAARRQQLGVRIRHPCGEPVPAEPAVRHREGSRTRPVGDDQTVQRNSLLGYLKFPDSFTEMPCSEGIWRHLPKSLD